jgi:hypothetical protein
MITSKLPFAALEDAYDMIATAIDRAGDNETLFLTKLALALTSQLEETGQLSAAIEASLRDL